MSSVLEQAGAVREPSEYATLSMDRHITGLWTQRSPMRDADVPYLYGKFYSASRFDSLIDGVNRELTARLTNARRAGLSLFNSNTFPAVNSFYSYKRVENGAEVVRVLADGQDGTIYDATPGQKTTVLVKGGSAGKARFLGLNTSLYITDGVENKKRLYAPPWAANTKYFIGDSITDSNGNLQYAMSIKVGTLSNVAIDRASVATLTFSASNFKITAGMQFMLANVGTATFLNGVPLIAINVAALTVTCLVAHGFYASAADTGAANCPNVGLTSATSGGSQPTWSNVTGNTTTDGLINWQCFGTPVYDWTPAAPTTAPDVLPLASISLYADSVIWKPVTGYATRQSYIVDSLGFIQTNIGGGGGSGYALPVFNEGTAKITRDGATSWASSSWIGGGSSATTWITGTLVNAGGSPNPAGGDCCIDTNGNLQMCMVGGTTGGSIPTWNTTYLGTTTDGGTVTWKNLGPYLTPTFSGWKYGYAYHCVDGTLTTLSPLSVSTSGVLTGIVASGQYSSDVQVDSVWIFRTAGGGSVPIFLLAVPNVTGSSNFAINDLNPDTLLTPQLIGPQADANDPPPIGMTAPIFHLGRVWAIYKNGVICSGGPDTITGNGATAFPPNNTFPITEQPIRLFSGATQAGPAVFIWGTTNIWVILGSGTASDPFRKPVIYMAGVGITSYDAVTMVGSTAYAFTTNGKAASLDPGAGYIEYGFPIGDQFSNVTTGVGGKIPAVYPTGPLYSPASTYVAWAELGSGDTAVYVSDGSVGWFRYSPVASPENGYMWSPRAVIQGGTSAVQCVEYSSGKYALLVGPWAGASGTGNASSATLTWVTGPKFSQAMVGLTIVINAVSYSVVRVDSPTQLAVNTNIGTLTGTTWSFASTGLIRQRDSSVHTDTVNGSLISFPSYDVKGNIVLAQSGEVAEIAHIGLKSAAAGARPVVGLLLGEISATQQTPFDWLDVSSTDPPNLDPPTTIYSDRYTALQNGVCPKCDNFQLAIDYGTQSAADELLTFSIYGAKYSERKQQ